MGYVSMNRQQRRTAQMRADFLEAAIQLILEKGYDAVTVTEIADKADYGRSTFYLHFKDKEDLVWHMLREAMNSLDERIQESVGHLPTPLREWRSWQMIFAEIDTQRPFYLQMDGELSRRLRQWQKDYLIETFEKQLKEEVFSLQVDVPAEIGARFIVGALLEILDYWLLHPEVKADDMAGYMFHLVYRQPPP